MNNDISDLKELVNRLPIGIYRSQKDGKILFANNYFINLLGFESFDEIKNVNIAEIAFLKVEDRDIFIENLLNKCEIKAERVNLRSKQGKLITVRETTKVFYKPNGDIDYFEGIIEDITESEEIISISNQNEIMHKLLFESASDGIFILENGIFIDCNVQAQVLFDTTKEDIIGKRPSDFSPELQPNGMTSLKAAKMRIKETEEGLKNYFEWLHQTAKGKPVYSEVSLSQMSIGETKLLAIVRDISERKKTDKILKESEERYRLIAENSSDVIWIMGSDFKLKYISPAVFNLRGYTPEEVKKQTFNEMVSPGSLDLVFKQYKKAFETNNTENSNSNSLYYIEQPHKNGGTVWTEVSTKIIRDEAGNTIEVQGVSRDITLRKKTEDEMKMLFEELCFSNEKIESSLAQKNILIDELKKSKELLENVIAEKDKFFSIIAHDLKSPFSSFLGMTKMLADGITELSVNEAKKQLTDLSDLAELLQKLLENLLDWSRVKRGLFTYCPDSFILYNLVENITDLKGFKAKEKEIEIVNNIPKDLVVYADMNMINTIMRNLISNALKFSYRGGKIIISTSYKSDKLVEFKIQDKGVGMSEDILGKLFSIKEKISSKGTENELGTGLGLLLCKEFVEMHGSNFYVETKLGYGTSFYFDLTIVNS